MARGITSMTYDVLPGVAVDDDKDKAQVPGPLSDQSQHSEDPDHEFTGSELGVRDNNIYEITGHAKNDTPYYTGGSFVQSGRVQKPKSTPVLGDEKPVPHTSDNDAFDGDDEGDDNAPDFGSYRGMLDYFSPAPDREADEREKKLAKRRQVIAAIGDGLSAMANLIGTSRGAENAPAPVLSKVYRERADMLDARRQKDWQSWVNQYMRAYKADKDAEIATAKAQRETDAADARLEYYKNKDAREAALLPYELDKKAADTGIAMAKAEAAKMGNEKAEKVNEVMAKHAGDKPEDYPTFIADIMKVDPELGSKLEREYQYTQKMKSDAKNNTRRTDAYVNRPRVIRVGGGSGRGRSGRGGFGRGRSGGHSGRRTSSGHGAATADLFGETFRKSDLNNTKYYAGVKDALNSALADYNTDINTLRNFVNLYSKTKVDEKTFLQNASAGLYDEVLKAYDIDAKSLFLNLRGELKEYKHKKKKNW